MTWLRVLAALRDVPCCAMWLRMGMWLYAGCMLVAYAAMKVGAVGRLR